MTSLAGFAATTFPRRELAKKALTRSAPAPCTARTHRRHIPRICKRAIRIVWRAWPCPIWLGAGAVDKRGLITHSSVPAAWNRDRGRAGTTLPGQALASPQEEQRRLERRKDISTAPASWVRQSRQGGKRDCKHVDSLPGPWGLAPLLPIYRRLGRAGQKKKCFSVSRESGPGSCMGK